MRSSSTSSSTGNKRPWRALQRMALHARIRRSEQAFIHNDASYFLHGGGSGGGKRKRQQQQGLQEIQDKDAEPLAQGIEESKASDEHGRISTSSHPHHRQGQAPSMPSSPSAAVAVPAQRAFLETSSTSFHPETQFTCSAAAAAAAPCSMMLLPSQLPIFTMSAESQVGYACRVYIPSSSSSSSSLPFVCT